MGLAIALGAVALIWIVLIVTEKKETEKVTPFVIGQEVVSLVSGIEGVIVEIDDHLHVRWSDGVTVRFELDGRISGGGSSIVLPKEF